MTKKGKKRQLDVEVNGDAQSSKLENQVGKLLPKKKKLKTIPQDSTAVTKKPVNVSIEKSTAEDSVQKLKKKNKKANKNKNNEVSSMKKSNSEKETDDKPNIKIKKENDLDKISRKKEINAKKRKKSNDRRKIQRQEVGQFPSLSNLSLEEMKQKIADIQSRETISKTAVRKLRTLKKKVQIIESGGVDTKAEKRNSTSLDDVKVQSNKKFKGDVKSKNIKTEADEEGENKIINTKKQKKDKQALKKGAKKQPFAVDKAYNDSVEEPTKEKKLNKASLKKMKAKNDNSVVKGNKTNMNPKKLKLIQKQMTEKPLFIEDRVGNVSATDSDSENDSDIAETQNKLNISKSKVNKAFQKKDNRNEDTTMNENDEDSDEEGSLSEEEENEDASEEKDSEEEVSEDDEEEDDSENDGEEEDSEKEDNKVNEQKIGKLKNLCKKNKKSEKVNIKAENDEEEESESEQEESKESESDETTPPKVQITKEKNDKNKSPVKQNNAPGVKKRYVVFVGNLAYDATTVDLKKHFLTKVSIVKDVRIPMKPGTQTPRGFGYVEMENSVDYEKALSLHGTFVKGRPIKVEYSQSGSKKVSNRQDVVHKNKKLHAMRKAGKLAGSTKENQKRSFRRNMKHNPKKET